MQRTFKRISLVFLLLLVMAITAALLIPSGPARLWGVFTRVRGRRTVESALAEFGPQARARLAAHGSMAQAPYRGLVLLALKEEKVLHVFGTSDSQPPTLIKTYPILAASGGPGPKTAQGDNQVPEGVYRVESLNPNSAFHLALRLDYPNDEDRRVARAEGRDTAKLGSDIMIHGKSASIGCLAMGNEAIEEVFTLAAEADVTRIEVLIAPFDLRNKNPVAEPRRWVLGRYAVLQGAMAKLPIP